MKLNFTVIILFFFVNQIAIAENYKATVPVLIGNRYVEYLDACRTLGQVKMGVNPANIYAGPNINYKKIDQLPANQQVWFCDFSKGKQWIGIVYTKKGIDCGVAKRLYPKQIYSGRCHSGWIQNYLVEGLAG